MNQNKELEQCFEPGPFDVICGQGKTSKTHAGNIYFQSIIQKRAKEYAGTTEKRSKSKIVRNIIETIQQKSPNGGFVKKGSDAQWKVVGLEQAREKVSQSLRDTLAGRYRSSLMAKKKSRMESNLKRMVDFDEIIANNKFVGSKMQWLAGTIKNTNSSASDGTLPDASILKLMTETNFCILRQLKKDRIVQRKVCGQQSPRTSPSPPRFSAVDQTIQLFQTDQQYMLNTPLLK